MKMTHTLIAGSVALLLATAALPTHAGDGHDHGDAPAPTAGPALPRFTAVSELFELVGVVDDTRLTLYLDRYEDNSPVKDARLELELDGKAIAVETHAEGEFEAVLEHALEPGVVSVTATVTAGQDVDLLAGELDVHENTAAGAQPLEQDWTALAGWRGAGVLALGLVGGGFVGWGLAGRGQAARRPMRKGAADDKSNGGAA